MVSVRAWPMRRLPTSMLATVRHTPNDNEPTIPRSHVENKRDLLFDKDEVLKLTTR